MLVELLLNGKLQIYPYLYCTQEKYIHIQILNKIIL